MDGLIEVDNQVVALDQETMEMLRLDNVRALIAPKKEISNRIDAVGGAGVILDYLLNGNTLESTAEKIGIGRAQLIKWMAYNKDAMEPVLRASALALADDATKFLDDAAAKGEELTAAQAGIAKARAEHAMRIAGLRNRDQFSDKPPSQEINFQADSRPVFQLTFLTKPKHEEKVIDADVTEIEYDTDE